MRNELESQPKTTKVPRMVWMAGLLLVIVLILAACGGGSPPVSDPAPAATEAPTATEEAEATEPAAEEAEATEEPTEEAEVADTEAITGTEEMTGTEEGAAEATVEATEGATEEATEEASEEATAEATEEPAEEATAEATEEATEEAAEEALSAEAEAGRYLVTISRGCGCHFNRDLGGMAGGAFPFNVGDGESVYPANITPHEETGIGSWTPEDVATAIRTGMEPDGDQLHPTMPYMAFSHLSDEDALNIAAYLFSLEPIENAVTPRELAEEPAAFTPESEPPATAPTEGVERGAYLAQLARCGDCHTPKNEDGSPNNEMLLAGNRISEDEIAWNITPHESTSIGELPEEEIAEFLRTGVYADGSEVAGTMHDVIENYFSQLTEDDALAIATFLKSIPPIENEPE